LAACTLLLVLLADVRTAPAQPYPNEAPGYRFRAKARWRTLVPLRSTMKDVRRVLGRPAEATDLALPGDRYPGDDRAIQPVWTYPLDARWELLVYFVKSSVLEAERCPRRVRDRLYSIDVLPKGKHTFDPTKLPRAFRKQTVVSEAFEDDYLDGSGLVYSVRRPRGKPALLDRVSYGPSRKTLQELCGRRR
jgi:hypothetical protein